jgi:hypothetical protein
MCVSLSVICFWKSASRSLRREDTLDAGAAITDDDDVMLNLRCNVTVGNCFVFSRVGASRGGADTART